MSREWRAVALLTVLALVLAVLVAWTVANDRKLWALFVGVPYFKPGSDAFKNLFRQAAEHARLPPEWADSDALAQLVDAESKGFVGVPNYLWNKLYGVGFSSGKNAAAWPAYWARWRKGDFPAVGAAPGFTSRASGLGQLQPSNMLVYYPSGYAGIGVPMEEAIGMLRYIADRFGDPEAAWAHHKLHGTY